MQTDEYIYLVIGLMPSHHTYRLILKGVFEKCAISPICPVILIFLKFHNMWTFLLDKKPYMTMLDQESPIQIFLDEQRVKIANYFENDIEDERQSLKPCAENYNH